MVDSLAVSMAEKLVVLVENLVVNLVALRDEMLVGKLISELERN